MPKITVLLPVYNGERYLQETIASILGQSWHDFELLLVDDGSTDRTAEIIASFHDERIRVLKNPERLKLSGALNRGLQEAQGEYIARMDADDIALPQRLQRQLEYMELHPEIGFCGSAIGMFTQDNTKPRLDIYPATTEAIRAYALFDCPFCHPTVFLRKNCLLEHNLWYDGSYYPTEDYELWNRAIDLFPTVNLEEVLLLYRIHSNSMTGSDWNNMDQQAARIIRRQLDKMGLHANEEDLLFHRNIGRGRSCALAQASELLRAEAWLLRLLHGNQQTGLYQAAALANTVFLVWQRLCMNNTFFGLQVLKIYLASQLGKGHPDKMRWALLLLGSILKQKFVNRRER
ncbi:glycosyltransferase family 2 protein [Candidatus Electronema sp. PJ]|uniref:glycosyltransferase family 2 protein n=1 Tax=Candidatus Electronema sp. PJ TaxID=3401572 RepID=UPI003AA8F2E8